jgi:acyl-CoA thioesterase
MPTSFSSLLKSARVEAGALSVEVPDDWLQGRSVFGGMQAALTLPALRTLVPRAPLRTLQVTFIEPVAGTLEVRAQVLRKGKSATHLEARILHKGNTAASVIAVFGEARESVVRVTPVPREITGAPPLKLPFIPGVTPNFTQHFEARLLRGALPFTGQSVSECVYEVGMRDEAPCSEAHLIAIADYVPPVGLAHLSKPAPGSTLTWMLELLSERVEDLPLTGFRVDAELCAARDGYTSQSVKVWGPDGSLVAVSHQSMLVFG